MTEPEDFDVKRTQLRQVIYGSLTILSLLVIVGAAIVLFVTQDARARDQVTPAARCAVTTTR